MNKNLHIFLVYNIVIEIKEKIYLQNPVVCTDAVNDTDRKLAEDSLLLLRLKRTYSFRIPVVRTDAVNDTDRKLVEDSFDKCKINVFLCGF